MNQVLALKLIKVIKEAGKRGISFRELRTVCHVNARATSELRECLKSYISKGEVIDNGNRIFASSALSLKPATITRLNKTFGFAKLNDTEEEVFIPGKLLLGALPGDCVLISTMKGKGASPEGEVMKITKYGDCSFLGTVISEETTGELFIMPDSMIRFPFPITRAALGNTPVGSKVLCEVTSRGNRHSDHKIKLVTVYGDAQTASRCADAILGLNKISLTFSDEVEALANTLNQNGISEREISRRLDLRDERIFTIDGADTKDIDDAISIKRLSDFYELSVHIADVSHYVKKGSPLDEEAFNRGTSIYFADRVIPMLPKALSNGICSLNEGVDRLAFSCIMTIDKTGKLIDFTFEKTVIRSRVKGVYSEINQILDNASDNALPDALKEKYKAVYENIFLMNELAEILTKNKLKRGAPEIETAESLVVLDENSIAVDIIPRTRGKSELIIEEFMLMANEAAATGARLKEIPFVYRVHEPPSEDKLTTLSSILGLLGLPTNEIRPDMKAVTLAKILKLAKDKPSYPIINTAVLRSMSKAKYFEEPLGHYGLVLENYAQFTSPIRRYPDLTIHRILSEVVNGTPIPKIRKQFEKEAVKSARRSTETELLAMRLERTCDDCYKAEYMRAHIGEEYDGIISSLAPHGIYVELENTVEGLLRVENMPSGEYDFDGLLTYTEILSGKTYRIGDKIKVKCIKADVSNGNIDFSAV